MKSLIFKYESSIISPATFDPSVSRFKFASNVQEAFVSGLEILEYSRVLEYPGVFEYCQNN